MSDVHLHENFGDEAFCRSKLVGGFDASAAVEQKEGVELIRESARHHVLEEGEGEEEEEEEEEMGG